MGQLILGFRHKVPTLDHKTVGTNSAELARLKFFATTTPLFNKPRHVSKMPHRKDFSGTHGE